MAYGAKEMGNRRAKSSTTDAIEDDFHSGPALTLNEHGENWIPDIYMLEQSRSAKEFYRRLAELIRQTGLFSDEERRLLAAQAEIPWAKPKGRRPENSRNEEIFMTYILDDMGPDEQPRTIPSRKEAIRLIMKSYNLEAEAAAKAYDSALRTSGQPQPITRVKSGR